MPIPKLKPFKLPPSLKTTLLQKRFDPVSQLIAVYPSLSPRDQAKVCLELINHTYTKADTKTIARHKTPGIQNNVQINADGKSLNSGGESIPLSELLKIAAASEEESSSSGDEKA